MGNIILENRSFRLEIGADCVPRSLIVKKTGAECLLTDGETPLFSVTQERPYNNEVKLSHPNKRTTFAANRLRQEGDKWIVGFEVIPYEAVVALRIEPDYAAFTLEGFRTRPADYGDLCMDAPPAAEVRLLQLPVKRRARFGEWLNAVWDDDEAVCVLAASPHARIDSLRRPGARVLTADAVRGIRLKGCTVALIASETERFLDCIDRFEEDFGLPRGVRSRRSPVLNSSVLWTGNLTPENADEHIRYAKLGGFKHLLAYYTCFFKEENGYSLCGNYDYRAEYPNGRADVEQVIRKFTDAGITCGLHFLHTHIGLSSRYVAPEADRRLHKTMRFTLVEAADETQDVLTVEECPEWAPMADGARVLQFGGELIAYESYTVEPPYRFVGCVRGAHGTKAVPHPAGEVGGVLDVSEYGATSCYLDQNTSLQDEIADKLAEVYSAGFRFCYFDGSEGTNAPFEYHVPSAQYRVWKKLDPPPLLAEGAAKAHFSWHMLSGGNAFDIFPPAVFKEKIRQHPAEEAPRMAEDFTRINFGWWGFWKETQADHLEYGTSRAAAFDCPATLMIDLAKFAAHPRIGDILEVLRRWEDVRATGWLTPARKEALRNLEQEHTLLIDERGAYELAPCRPVPAPEGVRAFLVERKRGTWVCLWHETGSADLLLPAAALAYRSLDGEALALSAQEGLTIVPVSDKLYLRFDCSPEDAIKALGETKVQSY